MKDKIIYLKSIGVSLIYGISEYPLLIEYPKGFDLTELKV